MELLDPSSLTLEAGIDYIESPGRDCGSGAQRRSRGADADHLSDNGHIGGHHRIDHSVWHRGRGRFLALRHPVLERHRPKFAPTLWKAWWGLLLADPDAGPGSAREVRAEAPGRR